VQPDPRRLCSVVWLLVRAWPFVVVIVVFVELVVVRQRASRRSRDGGRDKRQY